MERTFMVKHKIDKNSHPDEYHGKSGKPGNNDVLYAGTDNILSGFDDSGVIALHEKNAVHLSESKDETRLRAETHFGVQARSRLYMPENSTTNNALEKKQIKKLIRRGIKENDDEFLLELILSILLPPLAVYLHYDVINDFFWIDLILTLLFWIPGIIFALLVITDTI